MSQPARFQFSIRELLHAITAIGALLALVLQNVKLFVPFHGTELTQEFLFPEVFQQIVSNAGISESVVRRRGGGSSRDSECRELSTYYQCEIPREDHQAVFDAIFNKIGKRLTDSGFKTLGGKGGGDGGQNFDWRYHNDSLCGVVTVKMSNNPGDPKNTYFHYFAVEFKK